MYIRNISPIDVTDNNSDAAENVANVSLDILNCIGACVLWTPLGPILRVLIIKVFWL